MAIIITAPHENFSVENGKNRKMFLAGGITNCPDWRETVIEYLKDQKHLTIYNPKRPEWSFDNGEEQIVWEFEHLKKSDIILFWFCKETVCPITLYELGMWGTSRTDKIVFVGIDPDYQRKYDIETQVELATQENTSSSRQRIIHVVYSLKELVSRVRPYC